MTIPLSAESLPQLQARIEVPAYELSPEASGIVHFGVGAFHRAHEAMFVDALLNDGVSGWSICGVGVLDFDRGVRDMFASQDNLYTLVTRAPDGKSDARIVGSIPQYLFAPDDPEAVLEKLEDPNTRIVSLTITEGGYGVDDATGEFMPTDENTLYDLAHDDAPRSVLGYIVRGLARRRENGTVPFTVMSCDNIQGNGRVARTAVLGFARRKDAKLTAWIFGNVAFPNSMVDRITPATTDETRADIAAEFGVSDLWPVRSEAFRQWVLEDQFTAGRPPFERVGVQVVEDVEPYELMKLRLLNASHQAMSYLGILDGETFVHDVCRDDTFTEFLLGYMHDEAIPTLQLVPGIDLDDYCTELIARFSSEAIKDTLARQVVDGSDRIPKFLLPVIRARLEAGVVPQRSVLVLAAWSRFLEGYTEQGATTPIVDRRREGLRAAVAAELKSPGSFLDYGPVFGTLGEQNALRTAFIAAREQLVTSGARAAIRAISDRRAGLLHG